MGIKTDAPGSFECSVYLKAWVLGDRAPSGPSMRHIDGCWFCHPIIHGDGKDWPLSIEEQATVNLAEQARREAEEAQRVAEQAAQEARVDAPVAPAVRRLSRRRVLAAAAAGVAVLVGGGFGVNAWVKRARYSDAQLQALIIQELAQLDAAHAVRGDAGIRVLILARPDGEVAKILEWIRVRQTTSLYGDVITLAASDPSPAVRNYAKAELVRLPPVNIVPHLTALRSLAAAQTDPVWQRIFQRFVNIVENS